MIEALVVTIRGIAGGGDGVATLPDGRTVFVPRTAPGDKVRLRNLRLHARFARAEIDAVLEPGNDRVTPPCPHYVADRCGSCQVMHLGISAQRGVKSRIAGDALRRIGKLDMPDPPMTASPEDFGYRSKVTFAMQDGRLGYHPVNEPDAVFEVVECLVAHPDVRRLHTAVRAARRHLPRNLSRVVLRLDRNGGSHVIVRGGAADWTGGAALHRDLERSGSAAVVWWHPEGGTAQVVAGTDDPWPASVFEQVHPAMGQMVRAAAVAEMGDVAGLQVWDLYAGIGESTLALLERGASVVSVESDVRAVQLAESIGPGGARRIAGFVEDVVKTLPPPDAILANPPRTGMDRRAAEAIVRTSARRIVYISCDPATLARDIATLAPRFRLARVQLFDQFPQTAHMESIAVLEAR